MHCRVVVKALLWFYTVLAVLERAMMHTLSVKFAMADGILETSNIRHPRLINFILLELLTSKTCKSYW